MASEPSRDDVAAAMKAMGCDTTPRQTRPLRVDGVVIGGGIERGCRTHRDPLGFPMRSEQGCPVAVSVAAAVVASCEGRHKAEALEETAEGFDRARRNTIVGAQRRIIATPPVIRSDGSREAEVVAALRRQAATYRAAGPMTDREA